jgi:hypothetical protein
MSRTFKDTILSIFIVLMVVTMIFLLFGCAELTEKADKPQTLEMPEPTSADTMPALAWGNEAWSQKLLGELKEEGMGQVATIADAKTFCPPYAKLNPDQRLEFWATFMVGMAKRESGYKPETTYQESFKDASGAYVISTGLFQLSQESTRQKAYKCPGVTTQSLKGASQNIGCAVNVLAFWVKKDGHAAGTEKDSKLGAGRYWSVARPSESQKYIASQTKALKICQ